MQLSGQTGAHNRHCLHLSAINSGFTCVHSPVIKSLSGNEAVAIALRQINPDVFPAFPITPSTEIPQYFAPAADAPIAALIELCSLSTGINSVSTCPFATKEAKYCGISVDGVIGNAGNTSGLI